MGYTLHYFDLRGRGEVARILFHASGTKFEDVRIKENWAELKPNTPSGHLPYLDVDGHQIFESFAIFRFLANRFGFAGKDEFEKAHVDAVADFWRNETSNNNVEGAFSALEKFLKKSGSGFVVPSGVSWVDFVITESFLRLHGSATELFEKYPFAGEYEKRVHQHPKIKSYIESRKPSSM